MSLFCRKWETKNEKVSCDAVAVTVPILTMLRRILPAKRALPCRLACSRQKYSRKEMRSTTVQSIIYVGKQSTKSKLFLLFILCNQERKTFSIFISFLFYFIWNTLNSIIPYRKVLSALRAVQFQGNIALLWKLFMRNKLSFIEYVCV